MIARLALAAKAREAKMRQNYDPFEDCLAGKALPTPEVVSLWSNPQISWVWAAAQLILALISTYDSIKHNQDLDKLLDDIGDKLDEILDLLAEIQAGIEEILKQIERLPKIIRGIVQANTIAERLGSASGTVDIIKGSLKPGFIYQYLDRLQINLDELVRDLGAVLGVGGGFPVLLIIAPYLNVWLAGTVALQKARRQQNPEWHYDSPWKQPFMTHLGSTFNELFTAIETQDRDCENIINKFPPHDTVLRLKDKIFVRAGAIEPPTVYRLTCPVLLGPPERLQVRSSYEKEWRNVGPRERSYAKARQAYTIILQQRADVSSFYQTVWSIYEKKSELLEFFVEPAGICA
jgi:hypothetical protein